MPASDYLENLVLNHLFRETAWTKPAALYVALLLELPVPEGTGLVEVSAAEYARIVRNPSDVEWTQLANKSVYNTTIIQFAAPQTNWGMVKGVALYDALTVGNMLAYQALDANKDVTAGGPTLVFQPGDLIWKMNTV